MLVTLKNTFTIMSALEAATNLVVQNVSLKHWGEIVFFHDFHGGQGIDENLSELECRKRLNPIRK